MTRLEQKKLKLEEEQKLIKSLQHHKLTSEQKSEFRKTSVWKNFRKRLFEKQKVDPLTLSKLPKNANLHHKSLSPLMYTDLTEDNFVLLGELSHKCIHFLYSHMCKDKHFMDRVMKLLNEMGELNNWKDIKDFK